MTLVRDLLKTKGSDVWSVPLTATVLETLKVMADKDVGALLVLDEGRIAGIISERDFVRSIAETGHCVIDGLAQDNMTRTVITVVPDQTLEECMQVMTRAHIRHLPVVEGGALVGLISIGDVVKEMISNKESTINSLENYIEGRGYGQ